MNPKEKSLKNHKPATRPVKFSHVSIAVISAIFLLIQNMQAQVLTFDNLVTIASLTQPKSEAYISKKDFIQKERAQHADTSILYYTCIKVPNKKNKTVDSTQRKLSKAIFKDEFSVTWQTTSSEEAGEILGRMKAAGFYSAGEGDTASAAPLLYQHGDMTINTAVSIHDSTNVYSFTFYRKSFPNPQDIYYADDLLNFTSHEYLVYFFGEPNVKKDIYYLSGNEMVKCSVLFSNTPRQVVFIWADEVNKTGISNLLFGGQQRLESSSRNSSFVGESNWMLKSGVHAGMSLYELRMLNGNDIKFYGGNSANSGFVVPENSGKLDFKKEDIILGCINCQDDKFASSEIVNADEAIADGKIVFVLSVILNAQTSAIAAKLE